MTPLILNWHQAYEAELLTCGGKVYHLVKLHRYGFPVPAGGVVVAEVYCIASSCQRDPEVLPWLQRRQSAPTWGLQPARWSFRCELVRCRDESGHGAVHEADILNPCLSA